VIIKTTNNDLNKTTLDVSISNSIKLQQIFDKKAFTQSLLMMKAVVIETSDVISVKLLVVAFALLIRMTSKFLSRMRFS